VGSRADDKMTKKIPKNLTLKGKVTPFFFTMLFDTSITLFFKIFCSLWLTDSFITDRVHTENG